MSTVVPATAPAWVLERAFERRWGGKRASPVLLLQSLLLTVVPIGLETAFLIRVYGNYGSGAMTAAAAVAGRLRRASDSTYEEGAGKGRGHQRRRLGIGGLHAGVA